MVTLKVPAGCCGRVVGVLAQAARDARPAWFAEVMATGIVSTALWQAGQPHLSAALLVIAAASFVILLTASAWRAAIYPARLSRDLACPGRAFTCFALTAACDVLGDRLAVDGHRYLAAALAAAALAAWLVLTCLVPGRLALRSRAPHMRITDIGGTWYLWTVATQSLAIAAVFLQATGLLPARPAALAAITAWSAGAAMYLATTLLMASRLLTAGLSRDESTAPYWVAMGAASITVLAAAQILRPAVVPAGQGRVVVTSIAVAFWILATFLIIPLAARSAGRHLCGRAPLRYRSDLWMIVFPAGMYATASMQLGTSAALPLIHRIGTVAAWPAAAAWAAVFTAMVVSVFTRPVPDRESEHQGSLYRGTIVISWRLTSRS